MSMWIERKDALKRLGPEPTGLLLTCMKAAWAKWDKQIRPLLPLCAQGSMADFLHQLTIEEVRRRFVGISGVTIHDNTLSKPFLLEKGGLLVQFRKLTTDFHTVNNPTETSEAFDRQEFIEGFPNYPRLTAGYQLGQYNTSVVGRWLAFVIGKECQWHHDLDSGEHSLPLEFPKQRGPSPADLDRARADRLRKLAEKKKREGKKGG